MPAWLAPVILGAASTIGSIFQNRSNAKAARDQMAFQERMSSTAAQRGAADYAAAGLNPALAYDKPAVGGSGASFQVGDPLEKGVSSALSARQAIQAMRQSAEQHAENLRLTRAQADKAAVEGATSVAQGRYLAAQERAVDRDIQERTTILPFTIRKLQFDQALQPYMQRSSAASALAAEYQLPMMKAEADWAARLGAMRPGVRDALGVLREITGSARSVLPFFQRR